MPRTELNISTYAATSAWAVRSPNTSSAPMSYATTLRESCRGIVGPSDKRGHEQRGQFSSMRLWVHPMLVGIEDSFAMARTPDARETHWETLAAGVPPSGVGYLLAPGGLAEVRFAFYTLESTIS